MCNAPCPPGHSVPTSPPFQGVTVCYICEFQLGTYIFYLVYQFLKFVENFFFQNPNSKLLFLTVFGKLYHFNSSLQLVLFTYHQNIFIPFILILDYIVILLFIMISFSSVSIYSIYYKFILTADFNIFDHLPCLLSFFGMYFTFPSYKFLFISLKGVCLLKRWYFLSNDFLRFIEDIRIKTA